MALSSTRETQLLGIKSTLAQVIVGTVNDDTSIGIDDRLRTIELATRLIREIQSFVNIETNNV